MSKTPKVLMPVVDHEALIKKISKEIDIKDPIQLTTYFQKNPVEWIALFLDAVLWDKQAKIVQACADHQRITVASGHDLGKSFLSACIVLWYVFTHPYSKLICTSVNFKQLRVVLWQQIAVLHRVLKQKMPYAGELFQTELRIEPGWFAIGISSDTPEGFQGYHEEHLMVLVDEAAGIEYDVFTAIQTCAASPTNKILLVGNPTDPTGFFAHTHSKYPGWTKFNMSCYESPNIYIGEDGEYHDYDPLPYPKLVSLRWILEKKEQWGVNSPLYKARVMGVFPDSAEDQLISNRYISAALARGIVLRKVVKDLEEGGTVISSERIRGFLNSR